MWYLNMLFVPQQVHHQLEPTLLIIINCCSQPSCYSICSQVSHRTISNLLQPANLALQSVNLRDLAQYSITFLPIFYLATQLQQQSAVSFECSFYSSRECNISYTMDIISRFIATSAILLHVLVILRGQNDLVTAQGKLSKYLSESTCLKFQLVYLPLPILNRAKGQPSHCLLRQN